MAAPDPIISSTINYYLPMVGDNFYRGSSLLMRFKAHPGAQVVSGGSQIREPILAFNPNSDWFTGDEGYTAADNQELSSAVYDWKFVRATPMITKVDLFKNSGDAAKVSLVRTKMQAASMEVTEKFLAAAWAPSNAPITNAILPILQLVESTTTYSPGGISSSDVSRWAGQVNSGSGGAFSLTTAFKTYYACSEGGLEPTDIATTKNSFGILAGALQSNQRYLDKNADAGFTNFTLNKAIVHFDSHIPTGTDDFTGERMIFLNLDGFRMYSGAGLNFAAEEKAPAGQSVYTWEIVLACALTTNMRWANGVYHNYV